MVPFIIFYYKKKPIIGAILLIVSGITDIVDGFIARTFNMKSNLGKVLDPIADKLTQLAVLFSMFKKFPLMIFPFVFLLLKETIDSILGLIVLKKTQKIHSAVWHGKVSTALLYFMMFIHMIWYSIPTLFSNLLIIICTCMILISSILYVNLNIQYIKRKG
jgi:cardiolipin synthase